MFVCTRLNTQRSLKIIGQDKWRCTYPVGCEIFQRYVNKRGFCWHIYDSLGAKALRPLNNPMFYLYNYYGNLSILSK